MDTESARLNAIIESEKVIEFFTSTDKELKEVRWAVYGAIDTNEIIVRASVSERHFYHSGVSALVYPHMADRWLGIDVMDKALAEHLSNELWDREGDRIKALVRDSR